MTQQTTRSFLVPTAHGTFTLRPAGNADRSGLLALWRAAFGREADPDEWAWKYDGPFGHHTVVCVHDSGRIAAAYPGVPLPTRCHGRDIRIDVLMDSMSDPAFRGVLGGRRGLFVRTAEHYFALHGGQDKAWALFGFPGRRHFALGGYLLGYAALTRQPVYLTRPAGPAPRPWRPVRISPWEASMGLDLLGSVAARLERHYPVAVIRNATFLRWRYLDHPRKRYQIWLARSLAGRALGYVVILRRDGAVRVVDMRLPPDQGLVRAFVSRLAREAGADRLEVWMPAGHFLQPLFQAAGFVPEPEPIGFIAGRRDLVAEAAGVLDQDMFYTLGDTDVD